MKIKIFTAILCFCVFAFSPVLGADDTTMTEADLARQMELCAAEKPEDGTLDCVAAALTAGILYEESCDAGNLVHCAKYAINMIETDTTASDFQPIGQRLEKACNGGVAEACTELSLRFRNGWRGKSILHSGAGLEQNAELAVDFARRGCDLGSLMACQYMGVHAYNGLGMERDIKAALGYFEKVCEAGKDADVCDTRDKIKADVAAQ